LVLDYSRNLQSCVKFCAEFKETEIFLLGDNWIIDLFLERKDFAPASEKTRQKPTILLQIFAEFKEVKILRLGDNWIIDPFLERTILLQSSQQQGIKSTKEISAESFR
jgi:hypothetical protein